MNEFTDTVARRSFRGLSKKYRSGEIDMDYIHPRVMSFLGYVKHCDASRTTRAVAREGGIGARWVKIVSVFCFYPNSSEAQ